jgi:hypothetical protein
VFLFPAAISNFFCDISSITSSWSVIITWAIHNQNNFVYTHFLALGCVTKGPLKPKSWNMQSCAVNPLSPELNPICHLLALLASHFLHVSRIRVKSLTLRLLMSYIYIWSTYSWCF